MRTAGELSPSLLKLVAPFTVDAIVGRGRVAARLEDDELLMEAGVKPYLLACLAYDSKCVRGRHTP